MTLDPRKRGKLDYLTWEIMFFAFIRSETLLDNASNRYLTLLCLANIKSSNQFNNLALKSLKSLIDKGACIPKSCQGSQGDCKKKLIDK